jgi:hypothetical protein
MSAVKLLGCKRGGDVNPDPTVVIHNEMQAKAVV